jgi:NADPH:quinone reductase-like Zn-dependent oxidoreductase
VIITSSDDAKLARAKQMGADHGINYAASDWVRQCHARFGKAGEIGGAGRNAGAAFLC